METNCSAVHFDLFLVTVDLSYELCPICNPSKSPHLATPVSLFDGWMACPSVADVPRWGVLAARSPSYLCLLARFRLAGSSRSHDVSHFLGGVVRKVFGVLQLVQFPPWRGTAAVPVE